MSLKNQKEASKRTSILWGAFAFVVSVGFVYALAKNMSDFEGALKSAGLFGPILAVLLYGILSVTPVPTDPLTVACGALFGPIWGSVISWLGNTFAAVIEYYLGKGVSSLADFESKRKSLPFGLGAYPVDSPWFLIGGRMVPGFGSKIVSVMAGIYNVGLWRYTWTAGLANILGSVLYAIGGSGLLSLFSH
jgi:uncharacterized membrane protein YdjX (TVP38/TMEM64 family)